MHIEYYILSNSLYNCTFRCTLLLNVSCSLFRRFRYKRNMQIAMICVCCDDYFSLSLFLSLFSFCLFSRQRCNGGCASTDFCQFPNLNENHRTAFSIDSDVHTNNIFSHATNIDCRKKSEYSQFIVCNATGIIRNHWWWSSRWRWWHWHKLHRKNKNEK